MIVQAVKQGRLVTVIVLIVCVLGLAAALRMPVQMIPNLDTRVIVVKTGWPGATPQDVEKEILLEQERYLRALPNLIRMESSESLRVCRRLTFLRELAYEQETWIFPRSA